MSTDQKPTFAFLRSFSQGIEHRIVSNVCDGMIKQGLSIKTVDGGGRLFRFANLRSIAGCDVLVVHSPLVFAAPYVVIARLLGKRVVALIWDHYPVTLQGKRFDTSLRRRVLDFVENTAINLCSHLVVPTRDFLSTPKFARAKALPFWLPIEGAEIKSANATPPAANAPPNEHLISRIIFAGQVNATRGLEEAYAAIDALLGGKFELLVASSDPLPKDFEGKDNVTHLGFLNKEELSAQMARCDAGLVSLSPHFDGPGLPSKTFEYLSAGLRCVFFGRSLPHYSEALVQSGAGFVLTANAEPRLNLHEFFADSVAVPNAARAFSASFELDAEQFASHLFQIACGSGRPYGGQGKEA